MSQELKVPMSAILNASEVLADVDASEAQKEQAESISRSAESLLSILNDIQDLTLIEAGELTFNNTLFDLHEV